MSRLVCAAALALVGCSVQLPEPVQLVTIDVGWTRQRLILPAAAALLAPGGEIITLVKPHYEADRDRLVNGVLPEDQIDDVLQEVLSQARQQGLTVRGTTPSPITGHGGNREVLAWLCSSR